MPVAASARLSELVDALPLRSGQRVLEIGCGPGVAARLLLRRVPDATIVALDRSPRAVALARAGCREEIAAGRLDVRHGDIESFRLAPGEAPFDLAFAFRVGALDGRHPAAGARALAALAAALRPRARLFIDGGEPLRVVQVRGRLALARVVVDPESFLRGGSNVIGEIHIRHQAIAAELSEASGGRGCSPVDPLGPPHEGTRELWIPPAAASADL